MGARDVVEKGIGLGASADVAEGKVATEFLAAIDTVLHSRQGVHWAVFFVAHYC